jgi:alginate O-acetyltransferase complex protein AlgI
MLFNSLYFLIFLAIVLVVHGAVRSWDGRKRVLLAASWAFYATWSPRFLLLLVATTWVDFHLARAIHARRGTPGARTLVIASCAINLGVLAFFKYGRFLWESAAALAPLPSAPGVLAVVVPLGISFYTFHSISYVVDTYRGIRPPTDRFADFALYVAFFPQLIAGPITRWGFFGPQLAEPRRVGFARVEAALFLIAVGLVKKVVCADSLGSFVDQVYGNPDNAGWIEVWVALYAYAFQIYFDFSGYTDIAMGVAGLFGFRLPENFRHPYLAENPSEFWRRWHISLSTWLRDYLYVSLGGNRRGRIRTYVNLFVTMLLGGLWHGAAWTFVLWGGFHGLWLAGHRALSRHGTVAPRLPRWVRRLATFHLVVAGWVLFRARSVATATALVRGLFSGRPLWSTFPVGPLALVLVGLATHALATRGGLPALWGRLPRVAQGAAYGVIIMLIGIFSGQSSRFIYFQF